MTQRLTAKRTRIKTLLIYSYRLAGAPQRLTAKRTRIKTQAVENQYASRLLSEANGQKNKD